MDEEERRKQSNALHKESQALYDKTQNALCFVVLGAIFIIIGVIFIFLSYKRENNMLVGIDVTSLAFYIFILSMAGGAGSFGYGMVKFIMATLKRKKVLDEISQLK